MCKSRQSILTKREGCIVPTLIGKLESSSELWAAIVWIKFQLPSTHGGPSGGSSVESLQRSYLALCWRFYTQTWRRDKGGSCVT